MGFLKVSSFLLLDWIPWDKYFLKIASQSLKLFDNSGQRLYEFLQTWEKFSRFSSFQEFIMSMDTNMLRSLCPLYM